MIENEELGLKVAVNEDEAMWFQVVKNIKGEIENAKKTIAINQAFLVVAERKVQEAQRKSKSLNTK